MKQIYIVTGSDYHKRPIMAYETRNDAVRAACAVNECAVNECDASEAADHIRSVPFMADVPKTVDLADVQTVIDITIKAVESVEARKGAEDDR